MSKKEEIVYWAIFAMMTIGMVSCFIVSPTLLVFGTIRQIRAMVLASSICAIASTALIFAYAVFKQSIWATLVSLVSYVYGMGVGVSILGK